MKYAQLIMGLLIGTALGGGVVASQATTGTRAPDTEAIKQIVRDTIQEEGELILKSVQNYQQAKQQEAQQGAADALKDPAVRAAIFDESLPYAGNKDGKRVIAEFFDYDCPVCKMQFKAFKELLEQDKELKIVFHEYPIFGPPSEENSKIGLAVFKLYPGKYMDFHEKMMGGKGHEQDTKRTYGFVKELGMDVAKIQAYVKSDEAELALANHRALGQKLGVQGTPTLIVGDQVIGHAVEGAQLEEMLKK